MLGVSASPFTFIPNQMVLTKEKLKNKKKLARDTMDVLENLGRIQFYDNQRFAENYAMVNGRFIPSHYMPDSGSHDYLTQLANEFEIPSTLRHYDVIGKMVNNLTEKLAEFPDVFRAVEKYEDDESNEFVRTQTTLMQQSIQAEINQEIQAALAQAGLDPNKTDFASEDEAMAYRQEMQSIAQAKTPPEIQKYMKTDWKSAGEIWAAHQVEYDKEKYNVPELERTEFRDMLFTDRCFRHYYLTGDGYMQETWNPMNTFFLVSPEIKWAEEGEYVGRRVYMTKNQLLSRYGWKMTEKEMKKVEGFDKDDDNSKEGVDATGFPYKVYAPFEDFKAYETIKKATGYDPINNLPLIDNNTLSYTLGNTPSLDHRAGLFAVTEAYWMSQVKYGKAVYVDPQTHLPVKELVDENFVVPDGWQEVTGNFYSGDTVNTVYWTWVPQCWKGIKISYVMNDQEALYLDLNPNNFQFKGDYSPYGAKLPVCGRVFNNRNATSMAFVDLVKPHQVGHNLAMNQMYQLMEREEGKGMIWDAAMLSTLKDWGGENAMEKVKFVLKEYGHVVVDTSPTNMRMANGGGQLPREINLELTAQLMSRAKLADYFEQKAYSQLGITPQIMGEVKATETATGVNTAIEQTSLNVQRYYTDFFEYKKRCLSMGLDIAQYVQANNLDTTILFSKSDESREWIKLVGTNWLSRNIGIFMGNSQQVLKFMNDLKGYFLNNNTLDINALDVAEVLKAYSPATIMAKLQEALDRTQQEKQQASQQQQQALQIKEQADKQKSDTAVAIADKSNETKKEVAWIQTFQRQPDNQVDKNADNIPDSLEYSRFNADQNNNSQKNSIAQQNADIKKTQVDNAKTFKTKELALKEKEQKIKEKKTKADIKIAEVNRNKYSKK